MEFMNHNKVSHHPNHYPRAVLVVFEQNSGLMQHCTQSVRMKSVRMLAVSFYHLNLGVKTGFPLKAFIATSISIPKFPPYLDPNFRPFNMFFGEVSGVTFSFHSSLPCL